MVYLINVPTCFKSPKGSSIDLILTNSKSKVFNCGAVETGLSNHHLMIYGFFKSTISMLPPQKISYRNYKKFSVDDFNRQLSIKLHSQNFMNYDRFQNIFLETLDFNAPLKTKLIRGNNKPHVNRLLRKEIMKRSRLKHVANKSGNKFDILAYKRQRNFVVNLIRQQKKHSNIATINPKNRQSLWDLCKPYMGKTV